MCVHIHIHYIVCVCVCVCVCVYPKLNLRCAHGGGALGKSKTLGDISISI